jgi:hypothetical protein
MKALLPLVTLLVTLLVPGPAAGQVLAGRYRLAEGPDVAGQLELRQDGRFGYELAAGALDERAQGRWEMRGEAACLTTEPRPKPPELRPAEPLAGDEATVRVTWENGRGIPGVDFVIGFDSGEPASGYTQDYGWTLPPDEQRTPRWIELTEPIHRVHLGRMPFSGRHFRAVLVPNDIGVVDFQGACLSRQGERYLLRRAEGEMTFRRVER